MAVREGVAQALQELVGVLEGLRMALVLEKQFGPMIEIEECIVKVKKRIDEACEKYGIQLTDPHREMDLRYWVYGRKGETHGQE
jgi:hypothetical protein